MPEVAHWELRHSAEELDSQLLLSAQRLKKRFSRKIKQKGANGFTLAELLVASAISAVVLSIAYSLVNVILTSNKNDNTNTLM